MPNVNTVSGRVSIISMGRITALTIPRIKDTASAPIKPSTRMMPGNRYAIIKIATIFIITRARNITENLLSFTES
jgi:hypothetical protein